MEYNMEYTPFLTGSRKYGGSSSNSDIDIVMIDSDAEKLRMVLLDIGIKIKDNSDINSPDYKSYYICLPNCPEVNIVVLPPKEYNAWKYATEAMCEKPSILDKKKRIERFKAFKKEYLD